MLNTNATILEVLIEELEEDGSTVAFQERGDGLRTFIALITFLALQPSDVPPVLLIDEAETHLHYDAQADLVDVLLHKIDAVKVLYTTHSPGCLPTDLGTAVRLVAPHPQRREVSELRNDFWHSHEPGFSSLLFAMGAGAAAFSACRRAVLAEGPTEMVLLPTLIRLATGEPTLTYQVAPGLSVLRHDEFGVNVAARLAYLVDGDESGREITKQLLANGVRKEVIVSLPTEETIEDLFDRSSYVNAINSLLTDSGYTGSPLTMHDLRADAPAGKAAKHWAAAHRVDLPSKTATANFLIQEPRARIKLTTAGRATLRALHRRFTKILDS